MATERASIQEAAQACVDFVKAGERASSVIGPTPHQQLHFKAAAFENLILSLCPPSRESALALTNLEQALMWADKAIIRK